MLPSPVSSPGGVLPSPALASSGIINEAPPSPEGVPLYGLPDSAQTFSSPVLRRGVPSPAVTTSLGIVTPVYMSLPSPVPSEHTVPSPLPPGEEGAVNSEGDGSEEEEEEDNEYPFASLPELNTPRQPQKPTLPAAFVPPKPLQSFPPPLPSTGTSLLDYLGGIPVNKTLPMLPPSVTPKHRQHPPAPITQITTGSFKHEEFVPCSFSRIVPVLLTEPRKKLKAWGVRKRALKPFLEDLPVAGDGCSAAEALEKTDAWAEQKRKKQRLEEVGATARWQELSPALVPVPASLGDGCVEVVAWPETVDFGYFARQAMRDLHLPPETYMPFLQEQWRAGVERYKKSVADKTRSWASQVYAQAAVDNKLVTFRCTLKLGSATQAFTRLDALTRTVVVEEGLPVHAARELFSELFISVLYAVDKALERVHPAVTVPKYAGPSDKSDALTSFTQQPLQPRAVQDLAGQRWHRCPVRHYNYPRHVRRKPGLHRQPLRQYRDAVESIKWCTFCRGDLLYSPVLRRGPFGNSTLCNKCGLLFLRNWMF